jgi:hypothetical protein
VVYGSVTVVGGPLKTATVTVVRRVGATWVPAGRTYVSPNGTYRIVFKPCTCIFRVHIAVAALGVTRAVTEDIAVRPYRAYRLNVRMTAQRTLAFLPIFSY